MPQKILFATLDWGLGHSTRSVPLIQEHIRSGDEVVLASNGRSASFLRQYFPDLVLLDDIPDYNVTYPKDGSFLLHLFKQFPHILRTIEAEHRWLDAKLAEHRFDQVISDNRYGLWTGKIPCTLITHQIFPIAPFPLNLVAAKMISSKLEKFDKCLVPDYPFMEQNLSGKLSHGAIPDNVIYIGPQSRFHSAHPVSNEYEREVLVLISGPEPQRSIFQNKMMEILSEETFSSLIVCGKPGENDSSKNGNVKLVAHLADDEMKNAILKSRYIICRSGYSTIMDLHTLNRTALLVPTPGQTEQEYLAKHLSENFQFKTVQQSELSWKKINALCSPQPSQREKV